MLPFASHQHPLLKRLCSSAVRLFFRTYSTPQLRCVLGLESSCDDTGVAVISVDGKVLSEKVVSQTNVSVMLGGVLPTVARGLHEQEIRSTTNSVLFDAGISWKDIGSIAVTVKPGMPLSLKVGVAYAKELAALHKIPLIPVHHMEAHALTATLTHPELRFPYLVLLLSGGHGLLALARGLEDFLLLGTALDASPGDVLEKLARRMKLSRLGDNRLRYACGGRAIELMAAENVTDPHLFDLPSPRSGDRDCDFSFTGIHLAAEHVIKLLETEQREQSLCEDDHAPLILPVNCIANVCASVQSAFTRLICRRVQRAFEFIRLQSASDFPWPTALVVSGGVAANSVIRAGLSLVANLNDVPLIAPPTRLCTDNGVMIAWNGVLLQRVGSRIVHDPSQVDFEPSAPFGVDCRALVRQAGIKIRPIKIPDSMFSGNPL